METFFPLFFGVLSMAIGAIIYFRNRDVKKWPTTTGTILEKQVIRARHQSTTGSNPTYEVQVVYTYTVDGVPYTGKQLSPLSHGYTQPRAQKIMNDLGTTIPVFYNPKRPEQAYLRGENPIWALTAFAVGILMIVVGLSGGI